MNEKCSLSNLSRYLQVIGFLSLIIILIIVVYYYLRSNHSTILEKYEGYSRRDCVVYLKGDIADTEKCDATQGTSNYTDTCSYRFDGWSEFATYTDKDGKTIPYPKKIYTLTNTNSGSFTNPMFTNNCFKPNTSEEDGIPQEFEYNANNVVRYDEQGTSGNTAVGTNIFGGSRYSTMQFLNTANPTDNYNTLLDSICSASTKALGSLKDSVFYMFEFDGTTNKLTNITSVALNDDQTTFSISSRYNVLTNLPPIITPLKDAYGIQYDTNAKSLKIFKKNNIEKEVLVYKFNYMSYVCPQSQIKNYMRAKRMITPDKFIKYGFATTPYYSKIISVGNMNINKDWDWSKYRSENLNLDYSDMLKEDLLTAIADKETIIDRSYDNDVATAKQKYEDAMIAYDNASDSKKNFATNYPNFYSIDTSEARAQSLIGIQKQNSTIKMFNYASGYNTSPINNLNITIPQGAIVSKVGSDICIQFPYTGTPSTNDNTSYQFTTSETYDIDILIIGGGGAGGNSMGGGGGAGGVVYAINQRLSAGTYSVKVGRGGIGATLDASGQGTYTTNQDGVESSLMNNNGSSYISFSLGGASREMRGFGGGGGGVYYNNLNGRNGGSGGGSTENNPTYALTTPGSATQPATYFDGSTYVAGGTSGRQNTTQLNDYQGGGGGGIGGQSADYRNGNAGVAISITGNSRFYAAGGGAGQYGQHWSPSSLNSGIGGSGIGGNGRIWLNSGVYANSPRDVATSGANGTGSGGGGGAYVQTPYSAVGSGGSGIVIIRIKKNNTISPYNTLTTSINQFYSNEPSNTSKIIIDALSIQSKAITAFIFLQKGYYYFKADISGGNYTSDMMIYSDLLIFDERIKNGSAYNGRIVYKNNNNVPKYFNKFIYIPTSKFYKLAYRYTIYSNNTTAFDAYLNIYCKYQNSISSNTATATLIDSSIQSDNANAGNYSNVDSSINLKLTNYLFCGGNLNTDYNNANSIIMNLFSNVNYEGNLENPNYNSIIGYLHDIDFFNIKSYEKVKNDTYTYYYITLPNMIADTKRNDSEIINTRLFITYINTLKSNNNANNYSSIFHLPTGVRSIYMGATIDEIFGKNYERLVTKERVSNYSEISNTTTIRPKKIYVEAVAA